VKIATKLNLRVLCAEFTDFPWIVLDFYRFSDFINIREIENPTPITFGIILSTDTDKYRVNTVYCIFQVSKLHFLFFFFIATGYFISLVTDNGLNSK